MSNQITLVEKSEVSALTIESSLICANCHSADDNVRECEPIEVDGELITMVCDYCCEGHHLKPSFLDGRLLKSA
jgi:hypothetical protein